eukprot:1162100-Pelagomonas_calceolata.AAC.13
MVRNQAWIVASCGSAREYERQGAAVNLASENSSLLDSGVSAETLQQILSHTGTPMGTVIQLRHHKGLQQNPP